MIVKIVGKKYGTFPDERGVDRPYSKLYCLCPPPDDDGSVYDGFYPDTFGISPSKYDDIPVDCDADLSVNSSGKIIGIKLV